MKLLKRIDRMVRALDTAIAVAKFLVVVFAGLAAVAALLAYLQRERRTKPACRWARERARRWRATPQGKAAHSREALARGVTMLGLGGINCYLLKAGDGFVLIDTGLPSKRANLEKRLEGAGCRPGNLKLIVLTHGDLDHAGNAAHLRHSYGTKIVMHVGDAGMVERGDMTWNRKAKPDRRTLTSHAILLASRFWLLFFKQGEFEVFTPDMYVADGYELARYDLAAQVLSLPGHSKGSIGVLTSQGDLFCGDLLQNFGRPGAPFVDDLADQDTSIEKLRALAVTTVYPGHGKPFAADRVLRSWPPGGRT